MSKLATIEIETSPAALDDLLSRGTLHSHQDGRWRYSEWEGETCYCNDPTVNFEPIKAFAGEGRRAGVIVDARLYFTEHSDGTRGICRWDETQERVLRSLYRPMNPIHGRQMDWIFEQFCGEPVR